MKNLFILTMLFSTLPLIAQTDHVPSGVYTYDYSDSRQIRPLLDGTTSHLDLLKADARTLAPGGKLSVSANQNDVETLIIIKDGNLNVRIGDKEKNLGPKSVAMVMPKEAYTCSNKGTDSAVFYVINYKAPIINTVRADSAGGSILIDFNDLEFTPHDKGGVRHYYRRPTAMFSLAEMHVTTLNPGIKSHEPHTHPAAEFILMISGNTQMQIGDKIHKADPGDLYYVESEIPHGIQNLGDEACMYFAFQWEI